MKRDIPVIPADKTRFYVACIKLSRALGIELDTSLSDATMVHVLSAAMKPTIGRQFDLVQIECEETT